MFNNFNNFLDLIKNSFSSLFNNDLFRETTLTAVAAQKEFEESQVNEKELAEEMAMLMKKLNKFDNILKPHPVSSEDDLEELEEELEGMVVGYQDGELDFKMVESFFQITELLLFIQMNQ